LHSPILLFTLKSPNLLNDFLEQVLPMETQTLINMMEIIEEEICSLFFSECDMDLLFCTEDILQHEEPIVFSVITLGGLDSAIFLSMPKSTAELVGHIYTGVEMDFESENVLDITGELNNILAGNVKTSLCEHGITYQLSVPDVWRFDKIRDHFKNPEEDMKALSFDSSGSRVWTGVIKTESLPHPG
jgi:CheY-specific phosphatase CheX